jgi:hypothetical protein
MSTDDEGYSRTRRSLHAVAELVVAGPRFRATGDLRLRVRGQGFGTWEDPVVAVVGGDLVTDGERISLDGLTYEEVAARAGLRASRLDDLYGDGPHIGTSETAFVDQAEALRLQEALAVGDRALGDFRGSAERVLWPEHFDVAITVDDVTYGVSPGDAHSAVPYAYVGPHQPVSGAFWNAPFGASRRLADLTGPAGVADFFRDGARLAASSPQALSTNNDNSTAGGDR